MDELKNQWPKTRKRLVAYIAREKANGRMGEPMYETAERCGCTRSAFCRLVAQPAVVPYGKCLKSITKFVKGIK